MQTITRFDTTKRSTKDVNRTSDPTLLMNNKDLLSGEDIISKKFDSEEQIFNNTKED